MTEFPEFKRETIWQGTPSERTLCVVGDVTGNGVSDVILAGRRPVHELYYLSRDASGQWQRYTMNTDCGQLEAGGALADINGNGRLDFVAGSDSTGDRIFWFENPGEPGAPWPLHEICQLPANQSHDQFVADMDGDGRLEVYFWNQRSQALFMVPVPDDPTISPWPGVRPIITDVRQEGFAVADVDGDGRLELIAGQSWLRPPTSLDGEWERYIIAEDFVSPRVAAADFNGDGKVEVILAEGDASYLTDRYYGRVARCWFDSDPTQVWNVEILHDKLADPHSLVVADFTGNGRPDLFVGELGDPNANDRHPPAQRVYFNDDGKLVEQVIETGLGTHESKAITIDGRVGVVCKSYRNVRPEIPRTPEVDSIHIWFPEG
jgi:hypothetical protein